MIWTEATDQQKKHLSSMIAPPYLVEICVELAQEAVLFSILEHVLQAASKLRAFGQDILDQLKNLLFEAERYHLRCFVARSIGSCHLLPDFN